MLCQEKCLSKSAEALILLHKQGNRILEDQFFILLKEHSGYNNRETYRKLHLLLLSNGLHTVSHLNDRLIHAFGSFGNYFEANIVFCSVSHPTVYTWQAMLLSSLKSGHSFFALDLCCQMQLEEAVINSFIVTGVLKACAALTVIKEGRCLHDLIIKNVWERDQVLSSVLVDMYVKCGSVDEARCVFNLLKMPDQVIWSIMISGHAQQGQDMAAFQLLGEMQKQGQVPNEYTFSCLLKACSIENGKWIHGHIVKFGFDCDIVTVNALMDMYTNQGRLDDAQKLFDLSSERTAVSWGTMIAGYARHEQGLAALDLFVEMEQNGIKPNRIVYLYALKACSNILALRESMLMHDSILRCGISMDAGISTSLIDVYCKCGCLGEGYKIHYDLHIRTVVSWSAIIQGNVNHGCGLSVLKLSKQMQHEALLPDKVICLSLLRASGLLGDIKCTKLIHTQIFESGLATDQTIVNSLIDAYGKCQYMEDACNIFEQAPSRTVVSWSSIICRSSEHGHDLMALKLFTKMQKEGEKPDRVAYLSIMKACSDLGVSGNGMRIHDEIIKVGIEGDMWISNSLINMYTKCGQLEEAHKILKRLPNQDIITWGIFISACGHYGLQENVKEYLHAIQQQGFKPNNAICGAVLSACSRVGAVEEGLQFFYSMKLNCGVTPCVDHFNGMLDLLSRAGFLEETRQQLTNNVGLLDIIGLTSLLSACKIYGNMEVLDDCTTGASMENQLQ